MPANTLFSPSCENHLLSLLSANDYAAVEPLLEEVDLTAKQVIAERGEPLRY
jgi:hypothetical protein